ncbi:MAG: ATP-grasp domain-containing protein [Actinomycetota bacterium]
MAEAGEVGTGGVRTVLVVTPRSSYRSGAFVEAGHDLGHELVVASDADTALDGTAVRVDLDDAGAAATTIEAAVRGTRPDAVVGTDGPAIVVAASVAERFGLRGSPADAVRRAVDKRAQRQAAANAGVAQPDWWVSEPSAPPPIVPSGVPLVVKAVDRSGGQGVVGIEDVDGLPDALSRVRGIVGSEAPVLVETYLPGRELALDGLLVDGELLVLGVFDKPEVESGPTFHEPFLVRPARVSPGEHDDLVGLASAAVRAVGLTEGPVHVEVRADADGALRFLELAPRSIGGHCGRMVRPGGRSLEQVLVEAALGHPPPPFDPDAGPATGVHMVPIPASGTVAAIDGDGAVRSLPGITVVDLTVGVGERVQARPEGDRYAGFVFAEAEDPDDVETALRGAAARITVRVT